MTAGITTSTSRDGTRIVMESSGSGPALVVVNGALSDWSAVAGLRPHLDAQFTVVAYDRRGRGGSGDTPPYAPEREIEDLAAVIEAAGAPAFVYGHSSGGILALRGAMAGLPMRGLAVYEPPYILPGARALPPESATARLEAAVKLGDREGALREFLLEQVGLPTAALEAMMASPVWPRMLSLAHTTPYDAMLSGTSVFSLRDALAKVSVHTTVLFGTASFPWIVATARAIAQGLPKATLAGLEGQTHQVAPEVLAPTVARFFSE